MDAVKSTQGKVVGVIIPPPEIRAVVDKTASFVAKIGKSFEQRILSSAEGQTAKFNFMKPFDPYHAYYEMKIKEGEDGVANGGTEESKSSSSEEEARAAAAAAQAQQAELKKQQAAATSVATSVKASILNPIAQLAQTKPTEAPAELEFCVADSHPAGLTPLDVDIIKLAAQYTAANGREFLANLALREQRNPQYDFLKPTHMLFSYFTYLVDCYAKIVHPSPALLQQVETRAEFKSAMEGAVRRWQWARAEEERKRLESAEGADSAERLAFQAIDWFDFTVVETIDFPEDELLELPGLGNMDIADASAPPPPPRAPVAPSSSSSSAAKSAASSYFAPTRGTDTAADDAEEDDEGMQVQGGEPQYEEEDAGEDLSDLKVVADYQHPHGAGRGAGGEGAGIMTVDPISGKMVPMEQLSEHMRVQLLDPRWREQKARFVDKQKETGFAEGGSIADSLKMFARKRGDIFGQAATGSGANSAAAIAEQEALERRKAEIQGQVQWDGHHGSIGSVQQLKYDLASKVPAAFQLPPSAVKTGVPVIGPSAGGAPVVAHYALPPAPPSAMPMPVSAAPFAPPPPPPLPQAQGGMSFAASGMAPPPPPPMMVPAGMPFAPPPSLPPTFAASGPPLPPPPPAASFAAAPQNGEPASKRAKTEASEPVLLSAEDFLASQGGPGATAALAVQVPQSDDASNPASWNLNGQTAALTLPLLSTVKQVKEALSAQVLGGMPASKQQLRYAALGFLKDGQTLAELNIGSGAVLEFSLKSRGGKR